MKCKRPLIIFLVILSLLIGAHSIYAAGGDLLWEKTIPVVSPYQIISGAVLLSSELCILYGKYWCVAGDTSQSTGYLKVYNISTGDLLWERSQQILDHVSNTYSLLLDGNILYISDNYHYYGTLTPTIMPSTTYGAYNAFNGEKIWEQNNSGITSFTKVTKEPLSDNRLFALSIDPKYAILNLKVYQGQSIASPAIPILLLEK